MSSEEIVAVVDAANNVVGALPRREMRARRLPHRATYILVFSGKGELFVQRRTQTKDVYPGYLDPAAGGVVLAGEEYAEAARRELEEELGIRGVELTRHFDFHHRDPFIDVWGRVYSCIWDGPIVLQEEEVAGGFWVLPETFLADHDGQECTPDGLEVLRRFVGR